MTSTRNPIPYARQQIDEDDISAVVAVMKSDFLTQGDKVVEFERSVADYCTAQFAVAVNSATSALHLACKAMGLASGDVVWTSPITFAASSNAALYCGARVDFVDIDPGTFNISPVALEKKLHIAEEKGALPKIVIVVHMAGQSCDMIKISQLARQYNFQIIEDASHAIGARYNQEKVGSCKYSDITVFSFHPVKIMTTAEGGMAVTNSESLAKSMRQSRQHCITRDPQQLCSKGEGAWYYEQVGLGYNYRLTEIQAALGLSQLRKVDGFVAHRNELARQYDKLLSDLPLLLPIVLAENYSARHLYIIRLGSDAVTRRQVFDYLRAKGIGVNVHYIPVYHHPYYKDKFPEIEPCLNAEHYYSAAITLPLFPGLTEDNQLYIRDQLNLVLGR